MCDAEGCARAAELTIVAMCVHEHHLLVEVCTVCSDKLDDLIETDDLVCKPCQRVIGDIHMCPVKIVKRASLGTAAG